MEQTFNIDPKLIDELAKSVKTEKDLAALSKPLLTLRVERALNAELDKHLGKVILANSQSIHPAIEMAHLSHK